MKRLISLLLLGAILFAPATQAWAWSNGGGSRLKYLADNATTKPNFSNEESFTVNVLPLVVKSGYGLGTHDYILEQAMAQAIKAGADVSWVNVSQAQQGTSDPDHLASFRTRFPQSHSWYGTSSVGKAPRDVGIIYKELVAALNVGDTKTASRKLGWIAHILGDLSMPMHVSGYSSYIPSSRQHRMHEAAESDLDRYMKFSVGRRRDTWPNDVESVVKNYLPKASLITTATTPQQVRKIWFGNTVTKPAKPAKSARQITLDVAAKTKTTYGKAFWKNWGKTWKKGYVLEKSDGTHPSRGTGTKYLLNNTSGMLQVSANGIATLLVALSHPQMRATGIDHTKTPAIKLVAPKRPTLAKTSKIGKQIRAARGPRRKKLVKKYFAPPKKLTWITKFTLKNTSGAIMKKVPVVVKWMSVSGTKTKTLKTSTVWTDSKGNIRTSYALKTPKKKGAFRVTATMPTSDSTKAASKTFIVTAKNFKCTWKKTKK